MLKMLNHKKSLQVAVKNNNNDKKKILLQKGNVFN